MLFNSFTFLLFITIIFLTFNFFEHKRQNLFLLVTSYIFYGYWDWRFSFLLLTSTIVDFYLGKNIYICEDKKNRKFLLFLSIVVNLGILAFFKYFNFFLESTVSVFLAVGLEPHIAFLRVALPVGISFYTFKSLTYTIDIYKGKISSTNNFIDYALFVSFFPEILAGPIDRAANLLPQISSPREINRRKVLAGLNLILLGYFKKVAIADTLAPLVGQIFDTPGEMSSGQLWAGLYAYAFQIYGDFSGYTDIARGIALILGFDTMVNFDAPYLSRNITEFWRRWHISLSTWFRDYLYIPLGGNRHGSFRTYANLWITMLLCGLWHGAAWTFVLWGALHGIGLMAHRIALKNGKPDFSWPTTLSGWVINVFKIFLSFHFVAFAWVLFRAPSLEIAIQYYQGLLSFETSTGFSFGVLFAGSLLFVLDVAQTWCKSQTWITDPDGVRTLKYATAQMLLISVLAAAIANIGIVTPFIYFQF